MAPQVIQNAASRKEEGSSIRLLHASGVPYGGEGKAFQGGPEMKIHDLGELEGEILVFGGPYSNRQATEALLDVARDIPVRNVICTGDVVAYSGDPMGTVDAIRDHGMTVVAGNCERQLAARALDCPVRRRLGRGAATVESSVAGGGLGEASISFNSFPKESTLALPRSPPCLGCGRGRP